MEGKENTKLTTNNSRGIVTDIQIDNETLSAISSFKYLGAIVINEGSKPEILSRIAQTTTGLSRLNQFGKTEKSVSLAKPDWCAA